MKYAKGVLIILTCTGALTSTILFVWQGGFGGGHLRYDRLLYVLGLPWIYLPLPKGIMEHGFIWVVAIPWIFNGILCSILVKLFGRVGESIRN
jgi:hypothetical protein